MRHLGKGEVESALLEQAAQNVAGPKAILEAGRIQPELRLEIGAIAETLVAIAKCEGCAMIVMGQKGRTTLANLLMGSIAVLALSDVPVTLVR